MLKKAASLVYLDFAPEHEQPSGARLLLATVVSIVGSLLADALIVVIAEAIFPSTKGYAHFQFSDYAKLTVIGVIIACVAWPITTRITSQPRWMFFRMAIVVTLVLWLPDVAIMIQGQPGNAVGTLFVMHLAIALVTYNALVHLAPVRALSRRSGAPRARTLTR
jgi:bacteriorhodopsin